ncbi:MAG: hypothetical protein KDC98_04010, partial [Planctomycetes bacterium]|nr:hypothetical protein [Planctomycetota bacterium]
QANFMQLRAQLGREPAAALINDMAREVLAEYVWYGDRGQATREDRSLLEDAFELLAKGHAAFPEHLVLRLNLVRATLHHGEPAARARALQLAYDTLEADIDWQVSAMDDVLPFDFHSDCFNYRDYLTVVTRACRDGRGGSGTNRVLVDLIKASLWGYLARKTGKVEFHDRAAALDPGFARYRLDLADALLARGEAGDQARAVALLVRLAQGSVVFPQAIERLEALRLEGVEVAVDELVMRRLQEDTIDTRVRLGELLANERREAEQAAMLPRITAPEPESIRLGVLVPLTGSGRELSRLLSALQVQSVVRRAEIVVAVAAGDADRLAMLAAYDSAATPIRRVEVAPGACHAERLNACAAAARAPYLTIAMPGDAFRADAFERLADELDEHGDAVLACGSDGWTDREVGEFRPDAIVAISVRPRFTRRRQFETDCVGLHPVWRRSLHERHGWFDAAFGAAAEYEFWLRVTGSGGVRQLRTILATSHAQAAWRVDRDCCLDAAAVERARLVHWLPAAGGAPPLRLRRPLPGVLFSPAMTDEADCHARLGLAPIAASRQVGMTADFYGTALMHGDLDTAELMLRSVVESHPDLLSARLTCHHFLAARGRADAEHVLRAGLGRDPQGRMLRSYLEPAPASGPAGVDSGPSQTKG